VVVPYKKDSPYSSIKDTFSSMKVKESLAFSKPIIVSNIKGKEGFLKNYENCLFYKPNNAKDLSKKISLLLKDRELYKKISKNSLKLSKKFYWSILLEKSGLINYLKNG
jgi:glycosyltransferase involved in cell wall biosynthesis